MTGTGVAARGVALLAFHALNSSSSSLSLNNFLALDARFPSFEYLAPDDADFGALDDWLAPASFSGSSCCSSSSVLDSSSPPIALRLVLPDGFLFAASSFFFQIVNDTLLVFLAQITGARLTTVALFRRRLWRCFLPPGCLSFRFGSHLAKVRYKGRTAKRTFGDAPGCTKNRSRLNISYDIM